MKLLCLLLLLNIWACGQASSIGSFNEQHGQGLIGDLLDIEQNQAPVEQGEGLNTNYLQGYKNYDGDDYKNDLGDQFIGAGDEFLGGEDKSLGAGDENIDTWDQILGIEDQSLGAEDQALGAGDQSLGAGDKNLDTWDQILGIEDQSLGAEDQVLGAGDQSLDTWDQILGVADKSPDAGDQLLETGDQSLDTWDQILGVGDQNLVPGDHDHEVEDDTEDHFYGAVDQSLGAAGQFLDYPGNENDIIWGVPKLYESNDQYRDLTNEEETDAEIINSIDNAAGKQSNQYSNDLVLSPEESFLADQLNQERVDQNAENSDTILDNNYMDEKSAGRGEIPGFAGILSDIDNENNEYENQNLEETMLEDIAQVYADDIKDGDSISDYSSNEDLSDSDKLLANDDQAFLDYEDNAGGVNAENIVYENQNSADEEDTLLNSYQNIPDNYENNEEAEIKELDRIISEYSSNDDFSDSDKLLAKDDQGQAFSDFEDTVNGENEENIVYENQNIADAEDALLKTYENNQADDINGLEDILPDSYHGDDTKDLDETVPDNYQNILVADIRGLEDIGPDNYQIIQGANINDELSQNYQNDYINVADIAKDRNSLSDLPNNIEFTELEPAKSLIFRNDYDIPSEDAFEEDQKILEPNIVEPVLQVKVISFEGDEYVLEESDGEVDDLEFEYGATGSFRKLVLLSGPLLMVLGVFLLCVACCYIPRKNHKTKKRGTALLTSVDYKQMVNEA